MRKYSHVCITMPCSGSDVGSEVTWGTGAWVECLESIPGIRRAVRGNNTRQCTKQLESTLSLIDTYASSYAMFQQENALRECLVMWP